MSYKVHQRTVSRKYLTVHDVIVAIFLFLFFTSLLAQKTVFSEGKASSFEVRTADGKTYVYPSSFNGKVDIKSGGHFYTLEFKDGKAAVVEADCPDRLCVRTGKIWLPGEKIICLPGKLVITAGGKEGMDAINR